MLVDNILMFAAGWYRQRLLAAIMAAVIWAISMAWSVSIIFEDQPFRWDAPGLWEATYQVTIHVVVFSLVYYIFGHAGRAARDRTRERIAPRPK